MNALNPSNALNALKSRINDEMNITPTEALQRTIEHREIFHDEMLHLMRMIMKG